MLCQRNLRYLHKFASLRFARPSSPSSVRYLLKRLSNCAVPVPDNMLISVDGNISSGKSTLVSNLVQHLTQLNAFHDGENGHHVNGSNRSVRNGHGHGSPQFELEVIPEPLDKWCNLKGFNLLELFYKEQKKHNFVFQHYVQLTRLMDTVRTAVDSPSSNLPKIRIMERSLQNNRHCFLELARKSEQLQSAEFAVLTEWHSWLENNMDLHLDLVIYLRTTPEVAYQRMLNRGRIEESTCPLSYLTALHESYEDWLIRDKTQDSQLRHVMVVDANQSREDVAADCIEQLTKFLSQKSVNVNGKNGHKNLSPVPCVDLCKE